MSWRSAARTFRASAPSFSASRQRQPGSLAPVPANNALLYNLFTPQLNISYVPDVFGLNRRTVESLQAQAQSVRFQMLATYTTLTSNVVVTAIQASAMDAQIDATRQLIALNSHALEILNYQLRKRVMPAVSMWPRRNRNSRRSPPPCRR